MTPSTDPSAWFERSFPRLPDNRLLPNLIERLIGTPPRIALKIRRQSRGCLEAKLEHRWSIKEEIGHLTDLEDLWIGRLLDFMAEKATLREADLTNQKTHLAHHNSRDAAALLNAFTTERARLINTIDLLESDDLEREALHPRLKTPMRVIDLLYFIAEHDDHHLARMTFVADQYEAADNAS